MFPMLTPEQQRTALRAIGCSGEFRSGAWKDCGPLAQIALLTGNTEADLERWDAIGNGDGPLTIRRIQESDNGFAGWPLDFLEALDRAWKAGASRTTLESLVRGHGAPHTSTDGGVPVAAPTYEGPERRAAFSVAVDLKMILLTATVLGPLITVAIFYLQLRLDLRQNTTDDLRRDDAIAAIRAENEGMKARVGKLERAQALYCSGMRRDSLRLPDADC